MNLKKLSRRSLVAGAASAYTSVLIPRYPGGAAEFSFKCATTVVATAPLTARVLDAVAKIKRDSSGRFEIQVYPNHVLGGDSELLEQLRLGAIELYQTANTTIASSIPAAGLDGIPFIFGSYDDAWRAIDGPMGKYMRAAMQKTGLYTFEKTFDAAMRQIFNNVRPINSPDDLKGLKIRVPPAPILLGMFKALNAAPTPIDFKDAYTSLQTHLVDGIEVPNNIIATAKFYEILKYASETNHVWTGMTMLGNVAAMKRLPKDMMDLLESHIDAGAVACREDEKHGDAAYFTQFKQAGVQYNKADVVAFRAAIRKAGLYTQWRQSFGDEAWTALEKSVGTV